MVQTVRICMLNADLPVPNVHAQKAPTYGRIFHGLLSAAATQKVPKTIIESSDYDVTRGEYPPSLIEYDAILISGAVDAAYDDVEWIRRLDDFILDVYRNHPRVKIFGSCFGHQLICQSLLKDFGVSVGIDPKGYEIGVKEITLHKRFLETFGKKHQLQEKIRLQFVHHDHVVIPTPNTLPQSWMTLGSTEHCSVQGMYESGRVLTYQGHFEFDRFVNRETVRFFFPAWAPEALDEAMKAVDADDDADVAAAMVLDFFLERGVANKDAPECQMTGGLLTPPYGE
ncbi:class I glutamine amidotransferase-like protein [Cucurbitaria berberidis CBS 394.84]|uniref:Class I glutamine amidotransferase-like protein n=1 Tax=Cucurbitaria berberidis CBS 394.84 TaxID=1168544 RepID=A0A9P4GQI7_9PLEO|nr:class I glutamine amidotransferase-like protein [Cucurbitaria berberidis CBS 394.84]KAF1849556.1 class I glutamine amidotransferase-like protein [Cucurbitaria berberidis CBS 394.84]